MMKWVEKDHESECWTLGDEAMVTLGESTKVTAEELDFESPKCVQIILAEELEKDLVQVARVLNIKNYNFYDARTTPNEHKKTMFVAEVKKETLSLLMDELNTYIEKGYLLKVFSSDVELMSVSS